MSNILILNTPRVDVGLTTSTFTIPADGEYRVDVQATEVPVSGLSIVVNQNASPVYTSPTITPTQSAQQFKVDLKCSANDVITVVATGNAGNDAMLNTVKINTSIGQGF